MNKSTTLKMVKHAGRISDWEVYVNDHDATMYASNSYWLAPAAWFTDVLPEGSGVGTFDAKTARTISEDAPNFDAIIPADADKLPVIEHARRGEDGPYIIVNSGDDHLLYVFDSPEGDYKLRREFVEMFRGECRGGIVIRTAGGNKPAAVFRVDVTSATKANTYERVETRTETFVGLIMPVRK